METYIERDLVNYLYFELNKQRLFIQDEIFEYDIQAYIHEFLKSRYRNTQWEISREKLKIDHTLEYKPANEDIPQITRIEVKSFIKKKELLDYDKICDDVKKMSTRVKQREKAYFLLIVKESHLSKRSKKFPELIKTLNENNRKHIFQIDSIKVLSRIIRSVKTTYSDKEKNEHVHKNQIRVFLFEVLD